MTVFLLSLGGFPPLAGFIGKWYIFSAAVQEGHYWLAIIGVLTSVVSVFFYLGAGDDGWGWGWWAALPARGRGGGGGGGNVG